MTLFVADVGNSRMKWGRCGPRRVEQVAALPLDDSAAWEKTWQSWQPTANDVWMLAGVNPTPLDRLAGWLTERRQQIRFWPGPEALPIRVNVEAPHRVGVDRLLNAVAAWKTDPAAVPAVLVDAGSAVTVDLLDGDGIFPGGAIFPGLRLMTLALHEYTARLPLVTLDEPHPPLPGQSTEAAMRAGLHGAVVGGILHLVRRYQMRHPLRVVWLTGGDGEVLRPALEPALIERGLTLRPWPEMTLEGLRLLAEATPTA
ncbi:MAG: type III pantothenate kinase [Gemmatales bacterium]|nr:type III pantothenate kinase [Gemmatales bacterium]MDW8387871.1 type III pantothenate kinase [Gemmatales bacterium]